MCLDLNSPFSAYYGKPRKGLIQEGRKILARKKICMLIQQKTGFSTISIKKFGSFKYTQN